jgi:ComF family protein
MIHALKYDARRSLARHLAAEMRASAVELIAHADCVTPVPLHWWRQHRRGFNQARELARHLDRPLIDALIRTRHTRSQVELEAAHRRTNVQGAFGVRHVYQSRRSIQGLTIVLVDDVSTTGATLEECAKALKEAGAAAVYAITAARVVTRRPAAERIPNPESIRKTGSA